MSNKSTVKEHRIPEIHKTDLDFWKKQLQNISPLQLPTDFPQPPIDRNCENLVRFTFAPQLTENIKAFGVEQQADEFTILFSAFNLLLSRYSGQKDLCVGTVLAPEHNQSSPLPIRNLVQQDLKFIEFVQKVSLSINQATRHRQIPFEKIIQALAPEEDIQNNPFFQVMFSLKSHGNETVNPAPRASSLKLNFELTLQHDQIAGLVEYSPDLFKRETIERMTTHFEELLRAILAAPSAKLSQLNMLTLAEKQLIFEDFNSYNPSLAEGNTMVDLFEEQVKQTPDAFAVTFEGSSITYRELDSKANQLAHYLNEKGVKEEDLVPIIIERSLEMVVGFLAIMKAGAAYVPIDPSYPEERISYILEDTNANLLLSKQECKVNPPQIEKTRVIALDTEWDEISKKPTSPPDTLPKANNLAYVIYTSGSTGKPKGVLIEHGGLASMLTARKSYYSPSESILLIPSIAFDASITVIFGSLSTGGNLLLCRSDYIKDPNRIKDLLEKTKTLLCVPSYYRILLEEGLLEGADLQRVIVAGESLDSSLVDLHFEKHKDVPLYNEYGPTEGTVWATVARILPNDKITIGKPIENTLVYILDQNQGLNPVGVPGELCIAGDGLARGYLNRPEMTAEKFLDDPYRETPGARLYRTGDLAKWLPDGNLEYLGRMDDQVKIRGFRVELGEIESFLQEHGQVKQAVVLAKADNRGNKRLVAYVVPEGSFDKDVLVDFLHKQLPEHMVPTLWVEMESFPLTHNGKIDRKSLPEAEPESLTNIEFEAPRTLEEKQLAEIWQSLLGVEKISRTDDFFALGGNSLLAMRVIAAVSRKMDRELPIQEMFANPTIAKLAKKLRALDTGQNILVARERPEKVPLSFSQQSLWLIDRMEGSIQYHLPVAYKIKGPLDEVALMEAMKEIVNRHEILRTVIGEEDGQPYQRVMDQNTWHPTPHQLKENFGGEELKKEIARLSQIPFDLASDHMLRASLIQLSQEEHLLMIVTHHIASDGWSAGILKNELVEFYEANRTQKDKIPAPLPIQFADYALWQREHLSESLLEEKLTFWKEKLRGVTPLNLPTDFTRPPVQSIAGDAVWFDLNKELLTKLKELSNQQGTTLYMTLLTAFKALLYRYSSQEDICVGTPTAGRDRQEVEGLIGYFVNTLPLRTQVDGKMNFIDLLREVKATTVGAFEHQQVPFEKIVEAMGQERDRSRNPLFQVMFSLHHAPDNEKQFSEAQLEEERLKQLTSIFDFTFELTEHPNGLAGKVEYCTDLFREDTIMRMANHFQYLLQEVVAQPKANVGSVNFLPEEEKNTLLYGFNPLAAEMLSEKTILDMFAEQVERTPDSFAVSFEGKTLTYRQLDEKSNQLANYLIDKGVKTEDLVPICLDRCLEMMIGILGIMKAGGAYVPLDPTYPEERISYILEDTRADIALCNTESLANAPLRENIPVVDLEGQWAEIATYPSTPPGNMPIPKNLAYVIYTSGSTGKPKGVLIEHKTLFTSTLARQRQYPDCESALLVPSFAFDSSIGVIFGALTTGSNLILCKSALIKDPKQIQHLFFEAKSMLCVPSYYRFLLEEGVMDGASMDHIIVAGENLDETLVDLHYKKTKDVPLYNEYGPTEATIWATVARVYPTEKVTIGQPIKNTVVYIKSKEGALNPVGVPGELCISGQGLARGYLNRPDLTADKFLDNPFDKKQGNRIYRTGDLARWLPDGNIEFLGRLDNQVKLRGYRIELGEVESVINSLEEVKESAVILREDKPGQKKLVAYITGAEAFTELSENQQRNFLRKAIKNLLPDYMVPGEWVFLDRLPLTPNNKIDRKNLPKPAQKAGTLQFPKTEREKLISGIWCKALKVDQVDVEADFFEVGGHSLLAVKVMSALEKETGEKLPLNVLFQNSSIRELARYLDEEKGNGKDWSSLVPIKPTGNKPPLYIVHGAGSIVSIYFQLANLMEENQPVFGFQPKGLNGTDAPHKSIEEMAAYYNSLMISQNPDGPYRLGGYSFGGYVAFEMANQLRKMGKKVDKLILFDTMALKDKSQLTPLKKVKLQLGKRIVDFMFLFKEPKGFMELKARSFGRKKDKLMSIFKKNKSSTHAKDHASIIKKMRNNNVSILHKYKLPKYNGEVYLFKAKTKMFYIEDMKYYGWSPLVKKVNTVHVRGHHNNIFHHPEVLEEMADKIQKVLDGKK